MKSNHEQLPGMEELENRTLMSATLGMSMMTQAQSLSLNAAATASVSGTYGTSDMFKFVAPASGKVKLNVQDSSSHMISVFNASGKQVTHTRADAKSFSVKEGQTYYVSPSAGSGSYSLNLTSMPKDDYVGVQAGAKRLGVNSKGGIKAAGTVNFGGDRDFRSFTARKSGTMTLVMTPAGGSTISPNIKVYNANGAVQGYATAGLAGGTATMTFQAQAGVKYWVEMNSGNGDTGRYKMVGVMGGTVTPPTTTPPTTTPPTTTPPTTTPPTTTPPTTTPPTTTPPTTTPPTTTPPTTTPPTTTPPTTTPPTTTPPSTGTNMAPNVTYIDRDGDGYGVGSPKGPDANDNDPTVNTYASALKKYGSVQGILHALGYNPQRIFYIATNGNDSTGVVGDINNPYKTFDNVAKQLKAGDAVIFRGGTYLNSQAAQKTYNVNVNYLNGTASNPIDILGMPGEAVYQDTHGNEGAGLYASHSSYINFDNFITNNNTNGGYGYGVGMAFSSNINVKNVESMNHLEGVIGMQDLHNITFDSMVVHDNPGEHGFYLGAREYPDSNLTIKNSLIYGNHWQGIQLNGRVSNTKIENNIIHSNGQVGIQMIQGVSNSLVKNNLIMNNGKQGITLYMYDSTDVNIAPYDQTGNVFENNTIWVGENAPKNGEYGPGIYDAVTFVDSTAGKRGSLANNTFRNNILVTSEGAAFKFTNAKWADTTTITGNLIYRTHGDAGVMKYGSTLYSSSAMDTFASNWKNNTYAQPAFKSVDPSFNLSPQKFNFTLLSGNKSVGFQGV